ncbi:MAG: hydantoinase/oxoprolinase family protein, partial [Alphaproteobacteria bacterium]|nr:hydantoinase/oxoprolinase family protein [Alphaproteobacteria bacterium]
CFKVPSTPARPGASILEGIDEIKTALGLEHTAWREMVHTHSSTVATNALIERKGAKIGMIVTNGFRDLFELQRLAIPHPMRFDSRRPLPLIPRALVREVGGRIAADGNELDPLPEADVVAAGQELVALGTEIAIVVLLHSYRNPAHERALRDIVERHGIPLRLELSSEVWAQAREYERGVLTAINASIRPIVEGYVERLDQGLDERAIRTPARVARSNGGAELAETMRGRPVVALLSGPAAGVAGAAAAASDAGWQTADLMTLDVGGTSADIGVIRSGRPVLSSEEHIADFPLLIPTIAVSSIGAGGGSILWLDPTGSLKVGPRSVGADPGPACYGTSGSRIPALTDAFLVAGLLAEGQRLGGKLPLQMEPARDAIATLAQSLGVTVEAVADGAIRVANALMAAEASNVLARRGVDAPRFRMVAFGGAGPLVAALLAEEIGIDAILIPPFPGGLSALGAARADLEGDLVEPVYERLGALDAAALARVTANLLARSRAWIAEQTKALAVTGTRVELAADMRYDGQGYDVTVPLDESWLSADDFAQIRAAFHAAHRATYGHANETAEIWLKELRAHIIGATPKPRIVPLRSEAAGGSAEMRTVRLFGREVAVQVHERAELGTGRRIAGPAIVNQMDTTTWIPPGWTASVVPSGALVLLRPRTTPDEI